jgi:hypothetical protein
VEPVEVQQLIDRGRIRRGAGMRRIGGLAGSTGLILLAFGVTSLLDGRWRDGYESAIPGVLLLVCGLLALMRGRQL